MRPTLFLENKMREVTQAHQSENDRLRELLKETLAELEELKKTAELTPARK